MNLVLIIIFLIFLNFLLFFLLNKKKIKKFFNKTRIQEIDLTDVHEIFHLKEISKNLKVDTTPAMRSDPRPIGHIGNAVITGKVFGLA